MPSKITFRYILNVPVLIKIERIDSDSVLYMLFRILFTKNAEIGATTINFSYRPRLDAFNFFTSDLLKASATKLKENGRFLH